MKSITVKIEWEGKDTMPCDCIKYALVNEGEYCKDWQAIKVTEVKEPSLVPHRRPAGKDLRRGKSIKVPDQYENIDQPLRDNEGRLKRKRDTTKPKGRPVGTRGE